MKRLVQVAAAVAVLVFVGAVVGQTAPKIKDTVKGAIVSITIDPVDSTKATLVVGKEKQATITADSTTKITKDGAVAKVADLKVGDILTVYPDTGLAKTIVAKTPKTPAAGNVESGKSSEKAQASGTTLKGALVSITIDPVDSTKAALVVDKKKQVAITVDSTTKITKDGTVAKPADLKVDDILTVYPATGLAKTIVAKTPKAPKDSTKSGN